REPLKGARHNEVAKGVVDHVDGDALLGLRGESLFECSPDCIIFPEIGLEVDGLASVVDGFEHGVIKMLTVAEYPQSILADSHLWQAQMWKTARWKALCAPSRDKCQHGDDRRLEREHCYHKR